MELFKLYMITCEWSIIFCSPGCGSFSGDICIKKLVLQKTRTPSEWTGRWKQGNLAGTMQWGDPTNSNVIKNKKRNGNLQRNLNILSFCLKRTQTISVESTTLCSYWRKRKRARRKSFYTIIHHERRELSRLDMWSSSGGREGKQRPEKNK